MTFYLYKTIRNYYGFSQQQVAGALGITQGYLSKLENGEVKAPPELEQRFSMVVRAMAHTPRHGGSKMQTGKENYTRYALATKLRTCSSREEAVKVIKNANILAKLGVLSSVEHKFRKTEIVDGQIIFTDTDSYHPEHMGAGEIVDLLEKYSNLLDY